MTTKKIVELAKTKYVGCVTDDSFYVIGYSKICNNYDWEFEKSLDIIFSVGRFPKYYAN
tara:strand:+ start:296 stop:472 length:177 start_codon:yes stop_codon:yes gene_type:complete